MRFRDIERTDRNTIYLRRGVDPQAGGRISVRGLPFEEIAAKVDRAAKVSLGMVKSLIGGSSVNR